AVIVLSILLAVGIWADGGQLPAEAPQVVGDLDNNGASVVKILENDIEIPSDQFYEKFHREYDQIPSDQLDWKTLQDNDNVLSKSVADLWKDQMPLPERIPQTSQVFDNTEPECDLEFEQVGSSCYYFSDDKLSFDNALAYCESLIPDHLNHVSLAMIDYSRGEDQELLDAVASKNQSFWVGGQMKDDENWTWLDGRDIYLGAPFWGSSEPNNGNNKCLAANVTTNRGFIRSYLFDYNCSVPLNFLCQESCPKGFRRIGNHCYFRSHDYEVHVAEWQDARDYCQSLSMPEGGYHVDLAVLGLPFQDDYHLMNNLVLGYSDFMTWLGGFATGDGYDFQWIDGRQIPNNSIYWDQDEPIWSGVLDSGVILRQHSDRTNLGSFPGDGHSFHFVCQIFKSIT
ncbi:unnamed protein product, partial [Meganyctiphanes norvegica]